MGLEVRLLGCMFGCWVSCLAVCVAGCSGAWLVVLMGTPLFDCLVY